MEKDLDRIISKILELDNDEITNDLTPDDVDSWDSLNHMHLITSVEKTFKIHFSMKEVMSITSISVLRDLVKRHVSGQ